MADWTTITKKQFDAAYNKYLPSGWIKFAYKYFSTTTEMKDMNVKNIVTYTLGGLFLLGLIASILKLANNIVGIFVIPYSILLAILVLYLFSAAFLNKWRTNKIIKELDITKDEYNALVSKYY
jgi:hypothetical protein